MVQQTALLASRVLRDESWWDATAYDPLEKVHATLHVAHDDDDEGTD